MTSKRPIIRFSTPADREALSVFEHEYFPAVSGAYHAGYLYDHPVAAMALDERLAAPKHAFTFVAEVEGRIVGFAVAVPAIMPDRSVDDLTMDLKYLAVDPAYRRVGIGADLVKRIVVRSLKAQRSMITAHIPETQISFYRGIGWEVHPLESGLAWLPTEGHMRADIADVALGFPVVASKVLRPRAIDRTFEFPVQSGKPVMDAAMEAVRLADAGALDASTLDAENRDFLAEARRVMKADSTQK